MKNARLSLSRTRRTLFIDCLEDRRLMAFGAFSASSLPDSAQHLPEIASISQDFSSKTTGELGEASGNLNVQVLTTSANGETYDDPSKGKLGVSGDARATFVSVKVDGEAQTGTVSYGDTDILTSKAKGGAEFFAGAEAGGKSVVDWSNAADPNIEANVEAFIGEKLSGAGDATAEILGLDITDRGEGSVYVGALTGAGAKLSKEGLNAAAEAFAGDKFSGTIGTAVAGIGAGVTGEAWAGIGAKADLSGKFENGKLKIGLELGAALGIGGDVKLEFDIDTNQIVEDAQQFASNVASLYSAFSQSQFFASTSAGFSTFTSQADSFWKITSSAFSSLGNANTWNKAADDVFGDVEDTWNDATSAVAPLVDPGAWNRAADNVFSGIGNLF